jgi:hypothetical protein
MKCFSKWFSAMMAVVVMASPAMAADAIVGGKVQSINADKKEFVIHSDASGKDVTIKFGDDALVNRGGKESTTDLKVGDTVNVCHDNGTLTWTAHYILVREGEAKDWVLRQGAVKSYDPEKKQLVYSDGSKEWSFPVADTKVRLNKDASKFEDIKIGDHFIAIVETPKGEKETLKVLIVRRK